MEAVTAILLRLISEECLRDDAWGALLIKLQAESQSCKSRISQCFQPIGKRPLAAA